MHIQDLVSRRARRVEPQDLGLPVSMTARRVEPEILARLKHLRTAAGFDPSQDRDESGKWVGVTGGTMYHGTIEDRVARIKKEGLKRELSGQVHPNLARKNTVYVTSSFEEAESWATVAATKAQLDSNNPEIVGVIPAIIEINIPKEAASNLWADRNFEDGYPQVNFEFLQDINPAWIKNVKIWDYDEDDWRAAAQGDEDETIYVVILLEDGPAARGLAGFEPSQSRDKYGRWTGGDEGDAFDAVDSWSAVREYGENTHTFVNGQLRDPNWTKPDSPAREDTLQMIKAMDHGFRNPHVYKTVKKDIVVYRGIESKKVAESISKLRVGSVMGDKAFLSTSRSEAIAEKATDRHGYNDDVRNVMLNITLPKGMRYLPGRGDERESILNRGLRLKVTKIDRQDYLSTGITTIRVHARAVPGEYK